VHCSKITGDLLVRYMGVPEKYVKVHRVNEEIEFPTFYVTMLDANHCPGAALLLVKRKSDEALFLHCGDMRYSPRMKEFPELKAVVGKIDTIFLDTTYAEPKHDFMPQEASIEMAASEAESFVKEKPNEATLILVSAYTIGKERVVFAICDKLGISKVYISEKKLKAMKCLDLPEKYTNLFCTEISSQVHVCKMDTFASMHPYFQPNFGLMEEYREAVKSQCGKWFDRIIAFLPTGWAHGNWNMQNRIKSNASGELHVHLIPYSEHSSFPELEEFVGFLKPQTVHPTVYSDEKHRKKILHHFRHLVDSTKNKRKFLGLFQAASTSSSSSSSFNSVNNVHEEKKQRVVEVISLCGDSGESGDEKMGVEQEDNLDACLFWSCTKCTCFNKMNMESCDACGEERLRSQKKRKGTDAKIRGEQERKKVKHDNKSPSGKKKTAQNLSITSFFNQRDSEEKRNKSKVKSMAASVSEMKGELVKTEKTMSMNNENGRPSLPNLDVEPEKFVVGESNCSKDGLPFALLVEAMRASSKTTKRTEKNRIFVNAFRCAIAWSRSHKESLARMLCLSLGRIANEHEGVELSVGGSIVIDALKMATGVTRNEVSSLYKKLGDLGDVAFECKTKQRTLFRFKQEPLSVEAVFEKLHKIAAECGEGSKNRRTDLVLGLLRRCVNEETRFLVRMLIRNLRIGASEKSILDCFAEAVMWQQGHVTNTSGKKKQEAVKKARAAFNLVPEIWKFVSTFIDEGIDGLIEGIQITPGVPVKPMLAKVGHGVEDFMESFAGKGPYTCEFKYDGQRIQIHFSSQGLFRVFSRHGKDCTEGFPEVKLSAELAKDETVSSFIMDGEVVAINRNPDKFEILSFQTLSTRARKETLNSSSASPSLKKVDMCVFAFDLVELNGKSLVDETLRKRRELIKQKFSTISGRFMFVENNDFEEVVEENRSQQTKAMMNLMQLALNGKCEGLVAKLLDSKYIPGDRSDFWLKLKQDYITDEEASTSLEGGGLGDTLDLVPIGAWHGNGRKVNFWSPFLLACYDPETESYLALTKCMSGFTDKFYESQNAFYAILDEDDDELSTRTLKKKPAEYESSGYQPRVWFRPCQVWEIRGAELTTSSVSSAARGLIPGTDRGVSLRFPRFIKVRQDKRPEDATTPHQLAQMFEKQTRR